MKKIEIAKSFPLPNKAVTQKLAWLGTTGSGKTYGASKLAEEFWHIGAQFVVLDPVGVWYGLRLAKDGKNPSNIDIPIFGGLHGDVPLESTAGELLANLVVDKDLSCVIDVSQFESDTEKARFAHDFANRFFFRKKAAPSAVHLFIEECQEFVPQNPQKGEERMLHAFVRMQKLGRNFGIGSSYITQRPQEVNKKALNMAQTLFVFRTTGTHERNAIEKWIEDKSLDQSIAQDLPKIETGHCHVWSPEFLKISDMIHILQKETFNASATPEVGALVKSRKLAPIDLDKVRADMMATIEKAKADDPKELKKKIAELQKGIGKSTSIDPREIQRAVSIAVSKANAESKQSIIKANKEIQRLSRILAQIAKLSGSEQTAMSIEIPEGARIEQVITQEKGSARPHIVKFNTLAESNAQKNFYSKSPAMRALEIPNDHILSKSERKILNSIAWLNSIGIDEPEITAVAFLAGYKVGGGAFNNPKGALRSKGLIEYRSKSLVLTDAGRELAEAPAGTLTTEELHEKILERLPGAEKKLMQVILDSYPNEISNEELAEKTGYQIGGGAFNNPRGRLRTLGLIEYRNGNVIARDILFL